MSPTPDKWAAIERFLDDPPGTCPPGTFAGLAGYDPSEEQPLMGARLDDLEHRVLELERWKSSIESGRRQARRRGAAATGGHVKDS